LLPFLPQVKRVGLGSFKCLNEVKEAGQLVVDFMRRRCASLSALETLEVNFTVEGPGSYGWLQAIPTEFVDEVVRQNGKIKIQNFSASKI